MGWNVDPEGFGVIFQRTIPDFVTENLNPAVVQILAGMQLTMADIDRFICHPGGARVISALETRVVARIKARSTMNGRSSPTTATCRRPPCCSCSSARATTGLPARSLLTALGPGFTASCVALRHAA